VDYVLVRRKDLSMIRDVKVIPNEPCLLQHKLLICIVDWKERTKSVKRVFVSKCRVWKLKEAQNQGAFQRCVEDRARHREGEGVEELWAELKECMIEESEKICGKTKCTSKSKKTGWWDNEVKQAVSEKSRQYLLWKEEKNQAEKHSRVKKGKGLSDKEVAYRKANKESKRVIQRAKDGYRQKFIEELEREDRKGNTFKVVRRR
jgi:hypothetical protein